MKSDIYYTLDTDDQHFAQRLGECLNTIQFVFTHNPELALTRRIKTESGKSKKPKDHYNPHSRIFNGGPFTREQLQEWRDWVEEVLTKGKESIPLQHPAYRQGHAMALDRFRETADEFVTLFHETSLVRAN